MQRILFTSAFKILPSYYVAPLLSAIYTACLSLYSYVSLTQRLDNLDKENYRL